MSRKFVYVKLSGLTASYRVPFLVSGTQLSLIVPSYSSILGMLSYGAGREVTISDTEIGFRYKYKDSGLDLEKIHRWQRSSTGKYTYNETNIRKREIHYDIELELILSNLEFYEIFDNPKRQLSFGRSQDLVTIEEVSIIEMEETNSGSLSGTLMPVSIEDEIPANGIFYTLPEYFDYKLNKVRRPQNFRLFLALAQKSQEIQFDNLYNLISDNGDIDTFYLHKWK